MRFKVERQYRTIKISLVFPWVRKRRKVSEETRRRISEGLKYYYDRRRANGDIR